MRVDQSGKKVPEPAVSLAETREYLAQCDRNRNNVFYSSLSSSSSYLERTEAHLVRADLP